MKINSIIDLVKDLDTSRQTKNLNKLLIRILLHLQVEFSIYYLSSANKGAFFFNNGALTAEKLTVTTGNYGYSDLEKPLRILYVGALTENDIILVKKDDLFATFDKSTGTFIPKDEYKAYGAQRKN